MKKCLLLAVLLLANGCASVEYSPQKVYRVTGGYKPGVYSHLSGTEFLFSLLPPAGEWGHRKDKPWFRDDYAIVQFENKAGKRIQFEWNWQSDTALERNLADNPYLAPWRNGAPAWTGRVQYKPTERQLKSGDWSQPGYRQLQWHDFRYFGDKRYFCMTALAKSRQGLIEYGGVKQEPYNAFDYIISCPFRVQDRRNGVFIVRTGFSITDQQLKEYPERVNQNIEFIDKMLMPCWNSLTVIPGAYQFAPSASEAAATP